MRIVFCHRMSERSFFYNDKQFPVCARCTGVFVGQIIAISSFWVFVPSIVLLVFCCAVCLLDWLLQYCKIKMSSNARRFITGIMGGYGLLMIQLIILKYVYEFLIRRFF